MTHADEIRNMTDEELTEFINHITLSCYCCAKDMEAGMGVDESYPHCIFGKCTGKKDIADWLNEESKE